MAFTPAPGEILSINTQTLTFDADPANPAQVFRIQGRTAAVYRLSDPQGRQFALKVFSLAYRSPRRPEQAAAMAAYASLPGLNAAQRTVILPVEHAELVIRYPELRYAVLMPWLPGKTWEALKPKWATVFLERRKKVAVSLAGVLSCLEKQGLAHRNLSAANLLIDDDQIYLVDLESMLLPGGETENVPAPEDTAYRHPVDEAPARGRTADRYAGALLLSEIVGSEGEAGSGEVSWLFMRATRSRTLDECPSFEEWERVLSNAGGKGGVERTSQNELAGTPGVNVHPGIDVQSNQPPGKRLVDDQQHPQPTRFLSTFASNWWIFALRGLIGIVVWMLPYMGFPYNRPLFFLLVDGILTMGVGFSVRSANDRWWALLLEGLVEIGVGLLIIGGFINFVTAFLVWAFLAGILKIITANRLRREVHGEPWMILSGIVSILWGFSLSIGIIDFYFILELLGIIGVLLLIFAFRLRKLFQP